MQLDYQNVILKDRTIEDLKNHIKWRTEETEWMDWDAPWEFVKKTRINAADLESKLQKLLRRFPPKKRKLFEIWCNGDKSQQHIGWVNSYFIDDAKSMLAVGIDIPEIKYRHKGFGSIALKLFIAYLFLTRRISDIYCETWSGNLRMIRVAEKCGFIECERLKGVRLFKGKRYDKVKFKLANKKFFADNERLVEAVKSRI